MRKVFSLYIDDNLYIEFRKEVKEKGSNISLELEKLIETYLNNKDKKVKKFTERKIKK